MNHFVNLLMVYRVIGILMVLGHATSSWATVFFEADFEGGKIPYVGSSNRHSGGGYFSFLGGEITKGINPGDGTQDYLQYTNVILDDSPSAKNSITGSNYSLKTQYRAGHASSYQLNTTIIKFPETFNVYVRWYQKWSPTWIWPSDQQKLLKIKGPGSTQNFKQTWGHNYINLTKRTEPPNAFQNETYVFSDFSGNETLFRKNDNIEGNKNFPLDINRWYCIEVMVKSSKYSDSNGEYAYWIDDDLKFRLTNTFNYVEGADPRYPKYAGINEVEMQHVLQLSGGALTKVDMPTWMDNIVIANERIGCSGKPTAPPKPPSSIN